MCLQMICIYTYRILPDIAAFRIIAGLWAGDYSMVHWQAGDQLFRPPEQSPALRTLLEAVAEGDPANELGLETTASRFLFDWHMILALAFCLPQLCPKAYLRPSHWVVLGLSCSMLQKYVYIENEAMLEFSTGSIRLGNSLSSLNMLACWSRKLGDFGLGRRGSQTLKPQPKLKQ